MQQRVQRLLVIKDSTSGIATTERNTALSTKQAVVSPVPVEGYFANGTSMVKTTPSVGL